MQCSAVRKGKRASCGLCPPPPTTHLSCYTHTGAAVGSQVDQWQPLCECKLACSAEERILTGPKRAALVRDVVGHCNDLAPLLALGCLEGHVPRNHANIIQSWATAYTRQLQVAARKACLRARQHQFMCLHQPTWWRHRLRLPCSSTCCPHTTQGIVKHAGEVVAVGGIVAPGRQPLLLQRLLSRYRANKAGGRDVCACGECRGMLVHSLGWEVVPMHWDMHLLCCVLCVEGWEWCSPPPVLGRAPATGGHAALSVSQGRHHPRLAAHTPSVRRA
jgi:hypothetical protein